MNIESVLKEHKLWLDSSGKEGVRANLRDANLRDADLQYANLRDADLRGADLQDAYLCGACLQGADLQEVNLRGADLQGANLRGANLQGANLRGANLQAADLRGADLQGADLRGCAGERLRIKSIFCSEVYPITYTAQRLQIGCKNHSFEEWRAFSDEEISAMDQGALEFWHLFKDFIFLTVEKFPACQ